MTDCPKDGIVWIHSTPYTIAITDNLVDPTQENGHSDTRGVGELRFASSTIRINPDVSPANQVGALLYYSLKAAMIHAGHSIKPKLLFALTFAVDDLIKRNPNLVSAIIDGHLPHQTSPFTDPNLAALDTCPERDMMDYLTEVDYETKFAPWRTS